MRALRRAYGAPVSYERLQELGIEFPATVASELELAGANIERCLVGAGDSASGRRVRAPALRLDPSADPGGATASAPPSPVPASPAPTGPIRTGRRHADSAGTSPARTGPARTSPAQTSAARLRAADRLAHETVLLAGVVFSRSVVAASGALSAVARLARDGASEAHAVATRVRADWIDARGNGIDARAALQGSRRWIAPAALAAVAAAILAVVIVALASGGQPSRRAQSPPAPHVQSAPSAPHRQPAPTPSSSTPTTASSASASELEAQGHSLLESGRYGEATPVLRRAAAATGESVSACVQPTSEACLAYAYALYHLGRSLQLGGHPASAVPVLQSRLQIDNQRPVVRAALEEARRSGK